VSAPTKTECRDKLDELREEYRKAGTVGRRDITVRQVVADWLAHPPETIRSGNSLQVYTDAGKRICDGARGVPGIGSVTLARLTSGEVERLLSGMARAGYAATTVRQMRALLRGACAGRSATGSLPAMPPSWPTCPRAGSSASRGR